MKSITQTIVPILKQYHVKKASLFGSQARATQKISSDVDILVELTPQSDLFDFIGLKLDLESALHKKVDLIEYSAIKPALKDAILHSQLPIPL